MFSASLLPPTRADLTIAIATQTLLSIQTDNNGNQHLVPDTALFPRVNCHLPGGRLVTLECFCDGGGSAFFLME